MSSLLAILVGDSPHSRSIYFELTTVARLSDTAVVFDVAVLRRPIQKLPSLRLHAFVILSRLCGRQANEFVPREPPQGKSSFVTVVENIRRIVTSANEGGVPQCLGSLLDQDGTVQKFLSGFVFIGTTYRQRLHHRRGGFVRLRAGRRRSIGGFFSLVFVSLLHECFGLGSLLRFALFLPLVFLSGDQVELAPPRRTGAA